MGSITSTLGENYSPSLGESYLLFSITSDWFLFPISRPAEGRRDHLHPGGEAAHQPAAAAQESLPAVRGGEAGGQEVPPGGRRQGGDGGGQHRHRRSLSGGDQTD